MSIKEKEKKKKKRRGMDRNKKQISI